jgi:hypothetical protein
MSPRVEAILLSNYEEVMSTNLWWTTHYFGRNFGASVVRASYFARRGINQVADIWDPTTHSLLDWNELCQRFQLSETDRPIFAAIQRHFPEQWHDLCCETLTQPKPGEWVGIFDQAQAEVPTEIFQTSEQF